MVLSNAAHNQAISQATLVTVDFDGTLADTEPLHEESYNVLLELLAKPQVRDFSRYIGLQEHQIWPALLDVTPEFIERLIEIRGNLFLGLAISQDLQPTPHVLEFLGAVNEGSDMVLLTSQRLRIVEALLRVWGIADHFDSLHTASNRGKGATKLDDLGTLLADIDPGRVLVVEDSQSMISEAAAMGCKTVLVSRSYNSDAVAIADVVLNR